MANSDVLIGLSFGSKKRDDRRVDPVDAPVLGGVANVTSGEEPAEFSKDRQVKCEISRSTEAGSVVRGSSPIHPAAF